MERGHRGNHAGDADRRTDQSGPEAPQRLVVTPIADHLIGPAGPVLRTLLAGAALMLLIACANVAGLQVSRAARRERAFAIRAALGASGRRLAIQVLAESALITARRPCRRGGRRLRDHARAPVAGARRRPAARPGRAPRHPRPRLRGRGHLRDGGVVGAVADPRRPSGRRRDGARAELTADPGSARAPDPARHRRRPDRRRPHAADRHRALPPHRARAGSHRARLRPGPAARLRRLSGRPTTWRAGTPSTTRCCAACRPRRTSSRPARCCCVR